MERPGGQKKLTLDILVHHIHQRHKLRHSIVPQLGQNAERTEERTCLVEFKWEYEMETSTEQKQKPRKAFNMNSSA